MDNWLHKEIRLFVNELIVCSLNKLVQLSETAIHFSKKITPKQSRGSKITQKNCKNVSLRYLQCFCGINYKLSLDKVKKRETSIIKADRSLPFGIRHLQAWRQQITVFVWQIKQELFNTYCWSSQACHNACSVAACKAACEKKGGKLTRFQSLCYFLITLKNFNNLLTLFGQDTNIWLFLKIF